MSDFPVFNELTDSRYGRMLYNKNDIYIGRSLQLYGEFSYGEALLFEAVVKPGMTVIEVGANIGSHTVPLAQLVGPSGRVHAFEPQRIVFQTLCANIALNQLSNVITCYAASGHEKRAIMVPELEPKADNNFGGLPLGDHQQGTAVPVIPIDSLNLPACHFLKADVEGMEESVLRGAEQTIQKFRPILYVENDRKEKSEALLAYLFSQNYRLFEHTPRLFNPQNHKGNAENVFGNIVSKNLLCVHKDQPANISGLPEVAPPLTRSNAR